MLLYPGWRSFFSSLFCHALFQSRNFCGTFFISTIDFCLQDSVLDKAVVFYRGSQIADKLIHSSETMKQFLRKLQVKCYFVDQSPQSEYLFDHVTEYTL